MGNVPATVLVAALTVLTTVAGCLGPDPVAAPDEDEPAPPARQVPGAAPLPEDARGSWIPVPDEQVLYVAGADRLAGSPPEDGSAGVAAMDEGALTWTYQTANAAIVPGGWARFWVDVHEDAVTVASPGTRGSFCPWGFGIMIEEPGVRHFVGVRCPSQALPDVPAGRYEVRFDFDFLTNKSLPAGAAWHFTFSTNLRATDTSVPVSLLFGDAEPSGIALGGLREPFPPPPLRPCVGTYPWNLHGDITLVAAVATPLVNSGSGVRLPLLDPANVTGIATMMTWEAAGPHDERVRFAVRLHNDTIELEGPSPQAFTLDERQLTNMTDLHITAMPSNGALPATAVPDTRIVVDGVQVNTCP